MTAETQDREHARADDARTAAMADLREFLRAAEAAGEVQRVDGASADDEIGVLFDLSNMHRYPPVLLFENIPGYDPRFRILSNVRTSKLLVGDLTLEAVKAYRKRPKEKSTPIPPQVVENGPVLENVVEGAAIDLRRYPAPKWHPNDGGRYIGTECLVIMRDPETGWVNAGTYRVMVHDERTLGIFIDTGKHGDFIRRKYWAKGEPCPVVVTVGQAPILGIAGATATSMGESELALAGGRIGAPIRVVHGRATGLPIPADAELAFEGFMPPLDREARAEGPFGEWPGYYASESRPEPVVHVQTVYHRDDPLIIGQPPLTPVHPGQQIKVSRMAALWDALEATGVPGITGVWKLPGGGSRFIDVISLKQQYAGHAKMAGLVAAGCRAG
ncbi:MAG: UbiD family decarboxylase, partial [Candidatus Eremiobacteraeota bacterium]|nr:UbiD family decarboxylase [Candidatus Eremiobacteraeota bacterium]